VYSPEPKANEYPAEARLLTVLMYLEGSSYGAIGRVLKVNTQSVTNWVSAYSAKLPNPPFPEKVKKQNRMSYSRLLARKNEIYVLKKSQNACFESYLLRATINP
jgi:hypothetical protein